MVSLNLMKPFRDTSWVAIHSLRNTEIRIEFKIPSIVFVNGDNKLDHERELFMLYQTCILDAYDGYRLQ